MRVDKAELRAQQFLKHLGVVNIERQPEGEGQFPDFLVDDLIGVEIRRLIISSLDADGRLVANDSGSFAVWDYLSKLLTEFGPPINGVSWSVRALFRQPLVKWSRAQRQEITRRLQLFQKNPLKRLVVEVNANFSLELLCAGNTHQQCFVHGGCEDLDRCGYLVEQERKRNLELCIREKTRKRDNAVLKRKYLGWWLIFEDHIGYGCPLEFGKLKVAHDWNRVLLFNPEDPKIFCEMV